MPSTNVFEELRWRGLVHQVTDDALADRLGQDTVRCYAGFDPSADSLHVGNLLQILALVRMQRAGHPPIAVLGGATGMIGDPSGKSEERNLLRLDQVQANTDRIKLQLEQYLDTESGPSQALVLNNLDWLAPVRLLDFLRTTGKRFSVNSMMDKDSVRTRLHEREQGISFTEFTYMLLQAHDFLHLHRHYDCRLQVGGSDQWGNITAGVDLIRKETGERGYGLTSPLLTTADGRKLGKTEQGTIWLDPGRTSPYQLYQYWMRVEDRDAERMLRMLTFRSEEEVSALGAALRERPQAREAQRVLAADLTTLVHGEAAAADARRASEALFGQNIVELDEAMLLDVMGEAPSTEMGFEVLSDEGKPLLDLLVEVGVCSSKSMARKDLAAGAIYVSNGRVTDGAMVVRSEHLLHGRYLVLRRGKKTFHFVKFVPS